MAFTSFPFPSATSAISDTTVTEQLSSNSCSDVEFIFARGSGSSLNDGDVQKWQEEITYKLKSSSISYNFYELGSRSYNNAKYPAISVGFENATSFFNSLSAIFAKARIGDFNKSVEQGVSELSGRIASVNKSCPDTKFVLGGYSQGAVVIGRAIRKLPSSKIIYAATFGDPYLYLPEGYGLFPDACRNKNLSEYRIYAPDCHTRSGLLGTNRPYVPSGYSGKVGLWCVRKDIFCSSSFKLNNPIGSHLSYKTDGIYSMAATTIVSKANSSYSRSGITLENAYIPPAKEYNRPVYVTSASEDKPPVLSNLSYKNDKITYTLSDNTSSVLVLYNNIILGQTTETSLEVPPDITDGTFSFIPLDGNTEQRGEPFDITITSKATSTNQTTSNSSSPSNPSTDLAPAKQNILAPKSGTR